MNADRLRVGDSEREKAAADLGEHYADGRLRHDEYSERLDAIWTARTRSDLAALFDDLPRTSDAERRRQRELVRAGRWRAVPLLPVAVALIVVSVITNMPFWILIFVACWFLMKQRRHARRRYRAYS